MRRLGGERSRERAFYGTQLGVIIRDSASELVYPHTRDTVGQSRDLDL